VARTNMNATRIKPEAGKLTTLEVVRRERISPSFVRVTLGGGDIASFTPMGFDQWFRLFLPVSESSLSRLPQKLDTIAYLRYLAIAKTDRPVLRNYTVRAFRPAGAEGAELDVDFVLHGSASDGTAGPAASWAETADTGSTAALLDEGIAFNPGPGLLGDVLLVADETALPAVAGILTSLPRDAAGTAIIEVPHPDDAQRIDAPAGVDVRWIARTDAHAVPGVAALREAIDNANSTPSYGWAAGEQSLPTSLRRHWVQAGVPKTSISFTGYWKAGSRH
jgi:NADPH-dependent ferric siderophore reductase